MNMQGFNFTAMSCSNWKQLFFISCLTILHLTAQGKPKAYEVKKLAEGVYSFIWKEPSVNPIETNSLFVINDKDVLVVDGGWWPSATEIMVSELKKLTSKPVRYVVNTHWHGDHLNGNFVYKKYWPEVEFIAHYNTRSDFIDQEVNKSADIIKEYKEQPAEYVKWLKEGKDNTGKPLDPARRKRVQELVDLYSELLSEYLKVKYVVPDHVIADSLILYKGERVIKILFLGRGNTRGDIVVYLPKEKIVATGDLVVDPIPFGFGSYYKDWAQTLGKLEALNASYYVPGHGVLLTNNLYVHQIREMLTDLVSEVETAVKEGLSLDDTKTRVTLARWRQKFAGDSVAWQQSFDNFFLAPAVEGAWHQAKGDPDSSGH